MLRARYSAGHARTRPVGRGTGAQTGPDRTARIVHGIVTAADRARASTCWEWDVHESRHVFSSIQDLYTKTNDTSEKTRRGRAPGTPAP